MVMPVLNTPAFPSGFFQAIPENRPPFCAMCMLYGAGVITLHPAAMIITGPRAAGGPPVTPLDRKALDDYLAELSRTPISRYNRTEQLA